MITHSPRFTFSACLAFALLPALQASLAFAADWDDADIQQVRNNVESAAGNLSTSINRSDGLQNVIGTVRDELAGMAPETRGLVEEGVARVHQSLVEQEQGLQDFLFGFGNVECGFSTPCYEFRERLDQLLVAFDDLMLASMGIHDRSPIRLQLDFERARTALAATPDRVLYPVYRVLTSDVALLGSPFVETFLDTVDSTALLADMLRTSDADPGSSDVCGRMLVAPLVTREAMWVVTRAAARWQVIAAFVKSQSEQTADDPEAGVHGYIKMNINTGVADRWGVLFTFVADTLEKVALYAGHKLVYCTAITQQQAVLRTISDNAHPSVAGQSRAGR